MTKNFFLLLFFISFSFIICIIFDIFPLLRGPYPYPPEWQWIYKPFITWKYFIPILFALMICILYNRWEEKEKIILSILFIFFFIWQILLVSFGRGGLNVVFFKIAHPGMNGYFTTSLNIKNIKQFIKDFNDNVLSFPQHARGHPPGIPLLMHKVNFLSKNFFFVKNAVENIKPKRSDIKELWESLSWYNKFSSILNGFLFYFFSILPILPIFLAGKNLYSKKVAIRAAFLYGFVPSVFIFNPLPDAFFSVFSAFSFLFVVMAIKRNSYFLYFIGGLIFSIGIFFSFSLIPAIVICLLLILFSIAFKPAIKAKYIILINSLLSFLFGILILPLFLLFFSYNTLSVFKTIIDGLAPRNYFIWLFFNPLDFFLLSGIPVSLLYLYGITKYKKQDTLFFAFTITFVSLVISGASRAEVSRIWLPLLPFFVLIATKIATEDIKIPRFQFMIILFLESMITLTFHAFWVFYG